MSDWQNQWVEANRKRDVHADVVRHGAYGRVRAEWLESDGWADGFDARFFVLSGAQIAESYGALRIIVKATDTGVFRQGTAGGWIRM